MAIFKKPQHIIVPLLSLIALFTVCNLNLDHFYYPEDSNTTQTTTTTTTTTSSSKTTQTTDTASGTSNPYATSQTTTTPEVIPIITVGPTAIDLSTTSATIRWTTDVLSTAQVEYSLDSGFIAGFGNRYPANPSPVFTTNHEIKLNGLLDGRTYYYVVISQDSSGAEVISAVGSFDTVNIPDTGDYDPPVFIEGPTLESSSPTASTWSWTTNEPSTTEIEYSETPGFTPGEGTRYTEDASPTDYFHTLTCTEFNPATTYYYRIVSVDATGNEAYSSEMTINIESAIGWLGDGGSCDSPPCYFKTSGTASPNCAHKYGFENPYDITIDNEGNLYLSDTGDNRVYKMDTFGEQIGFVGAYQTCTSTCDYNCNNGSYDKCQQTGWFGGYDSSYDGPRRSEPGWFNNPQDIEVDTNFGYMYVSDLNNHRIQRWNPDGEFYDMIGNGICTTPTTDCWHTDSTIAPGTGEDQFQHPRGLSVDQSGNLYVADYSNHRIKKFNRFGVLIGCIGGGDADWSTTTCNTDYGAGDDYFFQPADVHILVDNSIFVVDQGNHRIKKWDSSGTYVGWIGHGHLDGWAMGNAPTSGSQAGAFWEPWAVTVNEDTGDIYIADRRNHRVQKWDGEGNYIGWIGKGNNTFDPDVTVPVATGTGLGEFNSPRGVAWDHFNTRLYVSDSGNDRIQAFQF
jgi:hypothetical protein